MVLRTPDADAYWVTSYPFREFVKHAWAGAYVCSAFRNESPLLSSDLIRQAIAVTLWYHAKTPSWRYALGETWAAYKIPELGMVTFVDADHVRPKKHLGVCYLHAGFKRIRETQGGLIALQLLPNRMPKPEPPIVDTPLFNA